MTTEEFIKILCVRCGLSLSDLAKLYGTSVQNFSQKIKRDTLSTDDMKKIAEAVGCQYVTAFILPNGERIEN